MAITTTGTHEATRETVETVETQDYQAAKAASMSSHYHKWREQEKATAEAKAYYRGLADAAWLIRTRLHELDREGDMWASGALSVVLAELVEKQNDAYTAWDYAIKRLLTLLTPRAVRAQIRLESALVETLETADELHGDLGVLAATPPTLTRSTTQETRNR